MLYVIEPEEKTIHAYKENGKWIHKEIDSSVKSRSDVDIRIDQKTNTLHAIYHYIDAGFIKYSQFDSEGN